MDLNPTPLITDVEGMIREVILELDFLFPSFKDRIKFISSGPVLLGIDPVSGKNVFARIGRFGPVIQIGDGDSEEKPRFASLNSNQRLESITLEDAMELFKLPRVVGSFEDKEMIVAAGRFGPYVRHDGAFFSLTKMDDPMTILAERAIELIEAKRKKDSERVINHFKDQDIQVLNGRWGPYIAANDKNFKIPKGSKEAKELSLADCLDIINSSEGTPQRNAAFKKKAAVPASKKSSAKSASKTTTSKAAPKKAAPKKKVAKKTTNTKKK
jgi:DNA topoisomerase-1